MRLVQSRRPSTSCSAYFAPCLSNERANLAHTKLPQAIRARSSCGRLCSSSAVTSCIAAARFACPHVATSTVMRAPADVMSGAAPAARWAVVGMLILQLRSPPGARATRRAGGGVQ
eukprot:scaffold46816_cov66-Phaeocystis_antarctica.AAC.1